MDFLGKLTLSISSGSLGFVAGGVGLRAGSPTDPSVIFLAYSDGDGYRLQATDGQRLVVRTTTSPTGGRKLQSIGTDATGTFFLRRPFFKPARNQVRLVFLADGGVEVSLVPVRTGAALSLQIVEGTTGGLDFTPLFLAPGLPELASSLQAKGADFSTVGRARVVLADARLRGLKAAGARFDGADLRGIDLTSSNNAPTNLFQAKFIGADLTAARLEGANLREADFNDAQMTGASLRGADLTDARLRIKKSPDLDLTSLTKPRQRTRLLGADFSDADDLSGVRFDPQPEFGDVPDRRTTFARARVPVAAVGKIWTVLDLTDAELIGPGDLSNLDARRAQLSGLRGLEGRTFFQARFDGALMQGVSLAGADLTSASFRGAVLEGESGGRLAAAFVAANLQNADFTDAALSGVDFSHAYLYGDEASVSGATLRRVVMVGAYLVGLDLSAVREGQLQGAVFTDACLVNASFRGSNLGPLDEARTTFVRCALQGADFTGATLFGADLIDAAVAREAGTFEVTLELRGQPVTVPISYQPTVLDPARATNASTLCPSRASGPCNGNRLVSPNAPTRWPAPSVAAARASMLLLARRSV